MSRWSESAGVFAATIAFAATVATVAAAQAPAKPRFGFGKPATADQIRPWDIDVRPDGRGLPPGRGTVAEGQVLYDAQCASCHGTFGESNDYMVIAGGVGSLGSDTPIRTTGSKLNHATTLFDYIRRAMPFNAPQSLTDDQVYALTAYVLNLNDILPADASLDAKSILAVRMPNRDGFTTNHGFMTRDGKPDTSNVACMRDCVAVVRLSSEMPDHARDAHGNLAEQARSIGTGGVAVAAATPAKAIAGADLAKQSACTACHGTANRIVGPSFREIAAKYAGDAGAAARLAAKVREGGVGAWGSVPMPAQPQVREADARELVRWILAGAK
jgi:S-disulfanyl-L-cysteine oxidoreductase SoxD